MSKPYDKEAARIRYLSTREKTLARLASKRRASGAKEQHKLSRGNRKLYQLWQGIKDRCLNEKCAFYNRYGGRGVRMHEPWVHDPAAFVAYILETLGPKPSLKHSLDRRENEGHYEPGNLRWALPIVQNHNRREFDSTQKMNAQNVAHLRLLASLGTKNSILSDRFGIGLSQVVNIKTGKAWT